MLDKGNNKETHKEKEIYKNMNDKKGGTHDRFDLPSKSLETTITQFSI